MRPRTGAVLVPAALAIAAGALWTIDSGPRRLASAFEAGSAFDESPRGMSRGFRYLRQRNLGQAPVTVLSRRIGSGALAANAVLIRTRPQRLPFPPQEPREKENTDAKANAPSAPLLRPLLTRAEEAWVRGGGRLVLGLDGPYGPLRPEAGRTSGPARKVFPAWRGVRALEPAPPVVRFAGAPLDQAETVFAVGRTPILSRLPLGRGDVVLVTVPEVLENERLARADHLQLLEALAGSRRPVAFDEWVHGYGEEPSLWSHLVAWGFGPSLALGGFGFVLYLWRGRTRLGPQEPSRDDRSEAVDLVDSLAQLYSRALSRRDALGLHLDGLRASTALRTALGGDALERRLGELVGGLPVTPPGPADLTPSQFLRGLHAVNEGYRRLGEHGDTRRRP